MLANVGLIDPGSIEEYLARGGYRAFAQVIGTMTREEVCEAVEKSGLRGRGGGGFPTGTKWKFALKTQGDQKYMVCNADEGDPGAFMDRAVIEGDPHRVLEGMAIAAYAIGANKAYVYIRAEYPLAIERLVQAIDQGKKYGLLGDNILGSGFNLKIVIKQGAGAFVCGEETALLQSIEGKRGMPRPRPPFPAVKGLFGKPTVINNVETLANLPSLLTGGWEKFAAVGTPKSKGTKVFALSGKVSRTGLIEVAMGTNRPQDRVRHRWRHPRRQGLQGGPDGRPVRRLHPRVAGRRRGRLRVAQGARSDDGVRAAWSSWTKRRAWWTSPSSSWTSFSGKAAASACRAERALAGCSRFCRASPEPVAMRPRSRRSNGSRA